MQLERADFADVCRTLIGAEPSVRSDVAATKAAWRYVLDGLPPRPGPISRAAIRTASERAAAIGTPGVTGERISAELTGPGSGLASEFHSFSLLDARGWQMIDAAAEQIAHGPPVAARFARANVGIYVESVYDSHFSVAQIGKKVLADYRKLGGPAAFGASLTQGEIDALAHTYSEPNDRLYPHELIKLGS